MQEAFSLSHYKIVRTYSTTSFRSTYLAQLVHEDQKKVLLKAYLFNNPTELEQLQARAEQLTALNHPSIIPLLDYGVKEDRFYTVRMYFPYGSLRTLLNVLGDQPLAIEESLQIVLRIGRALSYAHEQHIYHARLSVTNILIDTDGQALLGDFSLLPASSMRFELDDTDTNQFGYTAPEQFAGACDGRSDQYSLACLAYELLSTRPPFADDETSTIQHAHERAMPPLLSELRPELPQPLVHLIHKALAKNPEDRFPDMLAFLATFEAILRGDDVVVELPAQSDVSEPVVPRPAKPISRPPVFEVTVSEVPESEVDRTDKHAALPPKKSFKKKKKSGKRVVGSPSGRLWQADAFLVEPLPGYDYSSQSGTAEYTQQESAQEDDYKYVENGGNQEKEDTYPYGIEEANNQVAGAVDLYGYAIDEPAVHVADDDYGYTGDEPDQHDVYNYRPDEDERGSSKNAGDAYGTDYKEEDDPYVHKNGLNDQYDDDRYSYEYAEKQLAQERKDPYDYDYADEPTKSGGEHAYPDYADKQTQQEDAYAYGYADEPATAPRQGTEQPVLNQYAPSVGVMEQQQRPSQPAPVVAPVASVAAMAVSQPAAQPAYTPISTAYDRYRNIRVTNRRTGNLGIRKWGVLAVAIALCLTIIMVLIASFIPLTGRPSSSMTKPVVVLTPTSSFSYVSSQSDLTATAIPPTHTAAKPHPTATPKPIKPTPVVKPTAKPTTPPAVKPTTPPAIVPTVVPTPTPTAPTSYEAEASGNTIAGGAEVLQCDGCSGGERVGYLGSGAYLQFNSIVVNATGNYVIIIYYTNGDTGRAVFISSNGGTSKMVVGVQNPDDGDWNTVRQTTATVSLHAGTNTILLANPSYASPDIDRIVVD